MRVNFNKINLLHLTSSPYIYNLFNKNFGFFYLSYDNHLDYLKYVFFARFQKVKSSLKFIFSIFLLDIFNDFYFLKSNSSLKPILLIGTNRYQNCVIHPTLAKTTLI
jgi:hypothetical protein